MIVDLPVPVQACVDQIARLPGLAAIVLGGSRARGTATPQSDFDLGLYLEPGGGFDPQALSVLMQAFVDPGTDCSATKVGEWGPWIIGGGWFSVGGHKVDLLYRNMEDVRSSIMKSRSGDISMHYQPGHPHGICSAHWMGEIAHCVPLFDPEGKVAHMKTLTEPFPEALGKAVISMFLWEAGFSISNAEKAIARNDINYVGGCVFRAFSCLAQVLFALNGRYLINEKGAMAEAASLPVTLDGLARQTGLIWHEIDSGQMRSALDRLAGLTRQVEILAAKN